MDTDLSNKTIKIPVLKASEIVEIRHSKRRIDIYIGITDKTKETKVLHILQSKIKRFSDYKPKINHDFEKELEILSYKWHKHANDCTINEFTNENTTKATALISDNFTGYEKIFWYTGIKDRQSTNQRFTEKERKELSEYIKKSYNALMELEKEYRKVFKNLNYNPHTNPAPEQLTSYLHKLVEPIWEIERLQKAIDDDIESDNV